VTAAAHELGRSSSDATPYLDLLEENWYDTVESLRTVDASDLNALGLPLRFARELLNLAKAGPKVAKASQPTPPQAPPPHLNAVDNTSHGNKGGMGAGKAGKTKSWTKGSNNLPDNSFQKGKGKAPPMSWNGWQSGRDWWWTSAPGHGEQAWYGKSKGKSKHHQSNYEAAQTSPCEHKIFLDTETFDPQFGLNARIIGQSGCNIKKIESATGATVKLVDGFSKSADASEGLHLLLKCDDARKLEDAVRMATKLLDSMSELYQAWQPRGNYNWQGYADQKRSQPY